MERERNLRFLRNLFKRFYEQEAVFEKVTSIKYREFGFLTLETRTMIRHLSFEDWRDLVKFLCEKVPADCYRSTAYYLNPSAPNMEGKGWLGADLVFDIDADHIQTSCKRRHDRWRCLDCGDNGNGSAPENCPKCGSKRIDERAWFCSECLEAAKTETIKLLEFLYSDFGLTDQEISLYFSGHRGYHVHVESEEFKVLDQDARREIVDYITGLGIDPLVHGLGSLTSDEELAKALKFSTWAERLMKNGYDIVLNYGLEDLLRIGVKDKVASSIVENKEKIVELWWRGKFNQMVGVDSRTWEAIFLEAARKSGVLIDTVVTADVHRLIRLEGTLHSKTGLRKVKVLRDLESFDPLKEAVTFKKGEVKVHVYESPEFRVGESTFGPYSEVDIELPISAAVLLVCKGLAYVI
ncbi:MAG: DNA primase small subunit PriS [Candidatus Bathyarchaeia archaeon]